LVMRWDKNTVLPMAKDERLLFGSALAFRGEGTQGCKVERGALTGWHRVSGCCDRGLVELVSRAWGTSVCIRRDKHAECNPDYSELKIQTFRGRLELGEIGHSKL